MTDFYKPLDGKKQLQEMLNKNINTTESRREFEEWANRNGYATNFSGVEYLNLRTEDVWEAWQAARERHKPIADEAIESACEVLDDNIQSCDSGESDQEKMLQQARDYLWSMHFSNNPPTSEKI
jgi:hypothetical protein